MQAIEDPNFLPIVANLHHRYRKDDPIATQLEFLPDGIVLEAEWRANPGRVAQLEAIRNELGTAVSGELFFKEARRALRLTAIIEKRDIPRIHFARSDGALCSWLVKKLTGCKLSGAIEEHPRPGQALLATLAPDFDLVSVSDAELASVIKASTIDHLHLQRPVTQPPVRTDQDPQARTRTRHRPRAPAVRQTLVLAHPRLLVTC